MESWQKYILDTGAIIVYVNTSVIQHKSCWENPTEVKSLFVVGQRYVSVSRMNVIFSSDEDKRSETIIIEHLNQGLP